MSVLEALAAGTVVVATSVGGIPEAVQHASNGMLVPERSVRAFAAAFKNSTIGQTIFGG